MAKKIESETAFTVYAKEGIRRCACGNPDNFMAYKKIYTDDTIEYQIRCEKCRRYVSVIGNIETAIKSFNEMNDGAIPIRFSVESAPQMITIFSKSEDDVDTLVEKELSKCVKLRRLTEGDFWALLHRQEIIMEAEIVINNYAFIRKGEKVKAVDLERIHYGAYCDSYVEMLLDGQILSTSRTMIAPEPAQKIWRKFRKINLELLEE